MSFLEKLFKNSLKIKFSGKVVYNKPVANFLIHFVSRLRDIWLSSSEVMNVTSGCCEMLALWIFQDSPPTLYVLAYFDWESFCDV